MVTCRFSVDRDLIIRSWDRSFVDIRSMRCRGFAGLPYFQVIPRLIHNDKDAVAEVIKTGKSLNVHNFPLPCMYESGAVDLLITPIYGSLAEVQGAEIELVLPEGCTYYEKLQRLQPLLDVGTVSRTLAHGVRNPLNAIKGSVVYLIGKYSNEPLLVEFASIISEEIEKLDRFITKFLSSSLIDLEFSAVDLNELLKKVQALTQLQTYARGISCKVDLGKIPTIRADGFHLEHAVLNLVNNSIEAMIDGGTITMRSFVTVRGDVPHVTAEIIDDGPGMVDEGPVLFAAVNAERSKRGKGFGLFITREIIQFHGGNMEIQSEKGKGTTITLHIPVERQMV